jgi:hypothetical protein
MKLYMSAALVLCALSAVLVAAQTKQPATGDDAIVRADRTLVAAFEKGDKATINKLLDADFSWIDTDGIMWAREDALRAGLKPLVPSSGDVKITEFKYGSKVVWIQNNQGDKFAAHFWVLRPAGWRLLHTNEIAVRPSEPGANVRPNFAVPCINPCKEVPYKPISPSEQAALAAWQDQESGTGNHDIHMGDNLIAVNSYSDGAARAAAQAEAEAAGKIKPNMPPNPANANRPPVGAAPALYVRTWDFGDAIVAIMLQPTYGGKAYWSSRVFANHNGFWKMDQSYHTTIQAAPRMTALPMKEQSSKAN